MNADFEERYQTGDTPWDHGIVDFNLVEAISRHGIKPCRALDIGCGTGDNAIWLARQGFSVVACDLSATAIDKARQKVAEGNDCCFLVANFISDPIPHASYGFVFDRGCLHCIKEEDDRVEFVSRVFGLLDNGGLWLSLIGNADEVGREEGPPQLTATEITSLVEPRFEILSLASGLFGSDQETPPRAWICLMRKRSDA